MNPNPDYRDEALSETDTINKLINPSIYARGWTEDHLRREVTAGAIEHAKKGARRRQGRADLLLRVVVNSSTQPVAVAVLEAKKNTLPPTHGLEQVKLYGQSERLQVPFVFSTNGYMFVEYDSSTRQTSSPKPMSEFPTPQELRARYEQIMGFSLESEAAKPLLVKYHNGEGSRRYYQDAAIRAALEKIARSQTQNTAPRALLTLATGAGKTFIASHLLRRIADAGQLKRALFVCDRDELRAQALGALNGVFGSNAAEVKRRPDGSNAAANARIHVATYQTLDVASDDDNANFLTEFYPPDYFSHIIIDECHRSAWGKWSEVLRRNPNAVQVGLTATPRQIKVSQTTPESQRDEALTRDNIKHFGEPVYSYDLAQGIEDGYLAACEVVRDVVSLDQTGITLEEILTRKPTNSITGAPMTAEELRELYESTSYEDQILLPDRVYAMCKDLFAHLLKTGGVHQKTIVFCVRDSHADAVAVELNNLYAKWCGDNQQAPLEHYAFKCTAASNGADYLADLRGSGRSHFIATTVDLLSTGVDVPRLENIVFFRYIKSPISFYQMVGRGTRINEATGKLSFKVFDYTNASRLFGQEFITQFTIQTKSEAPEHSESTAPSSPTAQGVAVVHGFTVNITNVGRFVVTSQNGAEALVSLEEYRQALAAALVNSLPTLNEFRRTWVHPDERRSLLDLLVNKGYSPQVVRILEDMHDYDLFDVLAELGYGMNPLRREQRAFLFDYKHTTWLESLPRNTRQTIKALVQQFASSGTEGLEKPEVFDMPEVQKAGGVNALKEAGKPFELLRETKERVFTA